MIQKLNVKRIWKRLYSNVEYQLAAYKDKLRNRTSFIGYVKLKSLYRSLNNTLIELNQSKKHLQLIQQKIQNHRSIFNIYSRTYSPVPQASKWKSKVIYSGFVGFLFAFIYFFVKPKITNLI